MEAEADTAEGSMEADSMEDRPLADFMAADSIAVGSMAAIADSMAEFSSVLVQDFGRDITGAITHIGELR